MTSKTPSSSSRASLHYARPLIILFTGSVLFCLMGLKDSVWTYAFWRHPWPEYTHVMSRSVFEGDLPGVSDIGVVLPIVVFFIWLKRRRHPSLAEYVNKLQFIFLSTIMSSVVVVQSAKLLISRARPKVFEKDVLDHLNVDPSSIWLPGYMGWDGPRGYSYNSFPSGHASSCAVLIALVYLLPTRRIFARALTTSTVITLTCAMAIARSMAGMHWLSDSIASFFMVWATVDLVAQWHFSRKPVG